MRKTYSGKFTPRNPNKYKGNYRNIVYRSSWERIFFKYCDSNPSIIKWNSEEIVIPYRSPLDGRVHRYFTDVWIRYISNDGTTKEKLIEIKPDKQTRPPKMPKRKTKTYYRQVETYAKNIAKWTAAKAWAEARNIEFVLLTERETKLFR